MSETTTRAQQERRTRHARQSLVVAGTAGALATALVLGATTATSEATTPATTPTSTTTQQQGTSSNSGSSGLVAPGSGGTSHGATGGS